MTPRVHRHGLYKARSDPRNSGTPIPAVTLESGERMASDQISDATKGARRAHLSPRAFRENILPSAEMSQASGKT